MPAPLLPPPAPARRRLSWASRATRSLLFGAVVAICLTLLFHQRFWATLVYSLCIAPLCWLFIDLGRLAAARWVHRHAQPSADLADERRLHWPGWRWMAAVVVLGTLLGSSLGTELGNAITGLASPGVVSRMVGLEYGQAISILLVSLIPGVGFTYFFYARETIAAQEARVQAAQRNAAETRLKLLESQLEPHMLFNTLANLRVLIALDPPRAQAMLDQLIAFLRATLSASRAAQHPLAAEFERIADYLALMQVRMGERLQVGLELPAALRALPVPPLLLQPLVENAIHHGLEPHVQGGRIGVSAALEAGQLVLRVRDTGVGLDAAAASASTQFGLLQVRERLATLYGPAASLQLAAADDGEGGTLATVRLPAPSA